MNSDGKKISFGFSRLSKKSNILVPPPKQNKTVELIDCLEGAEIKVKDEIDKVEIFPLVIPIRGDANNIVSQIERGRIKSKKLKTVINDEDSRPDSELSIDELAARQLLKEARNKLAQERDTTKVHTLVLKENSTVQDGLEPSMNDYENVPIEDFGLALLRGMGWKEENSNQSKFVTPDLRPKGLGLGGQKIVDVKTEDVFDKNGKQLFLKEGAFAKIIAGPHKGKFCEVQFCDQWTGRLGVKINKTNEVVIQNELFVVPITKEDYILGSKVINNVKYEKYKELEEIKDHPNKKGFIDKIKGCLSSSEESVRSKSRQRDQDKVKKEYDSFNEEMSDDEYEQAKNRSRNNSNLRYDNELKSDKICCGSKSNSSKYRTHDRSRKTSCVANIREKSCQYSNRSSDSSEDYDKVKSRSKNRPDSRESTEEYKKSKYNRQQSNIKNRSSSSEGERSKSKNRSRSRSSREYVKKNKKEDEKHSKKKKIGKNSCSDDDSGGKRDHSKKHRQKNYSDEESSCAENRKNKLKKSKKSRRKRYSSSESDHENINSRKNKSRISGGSHKCRH